MKNGPVFRRTTCAVVAVAFLAVAVTGVLRLLHFRNGVIITVHEWIGLVFALAVVGHIAINWKALMGHLKRREVRWAALAAVLVVIGLGIVGAGRRPPFHRRGQGGRGQGGYGQGGYGQGGWGSDNSSRGRRHKARHRGFGPHWGHGRRGLRRSQADN